MEPIVTLLFKLGHADLINRLIRLSEIENEYWYHGYLLQEHSCMGQGIQDWINWNFLKAVFQKFYLVHSWILCPIYNYLKNLERTMEQLSSESPTKYLLLKSKIICEGLWFSVTIQAFTLQLSKNGLFVDVSSQIFRKRFFSKHL